MLSPLLANIALSALDEHFDRQWREMMSTDKRRCTRKRKGLGNWRIVRYADDFVLMVSGDRHCAEALREEVAGVLAPLGLRLSAEKTRVVHIDDGFDFLGFTIRRQRKRGTQKYFIYTKPSKKAIQSIKDKVKKKLNRSTLHLDLDKLLTSLNRMMRGWANYFRYGVSKQVFHAVDGHAWHRIAKWIHHKHSRLSWSELRRRFCRPGTWIITHHGVEFTGSSSVKVTRYRYRGSTIPTPWTLRPAAAAIGG
ncbi:group II intron maturase-specific domain-containing protein [Nonomuraea polychroma]|uniref:group II intron maturase-specific domain-containing protein n=1 Tax=Nonomuraea polychroma TaxID=46176 RepID=UPI003D8B58EF